MRAYGRCMHDHSASVYFPVIVLSSLWSSCDADQKPLKEEMGTLPGAGHLRVPCKGNKRVCHCHSRRKSNQTRQPRKQAAAGGGVDINQTDGSGGVRCESSAPALICQRQCATTTPSIISFNSLPPLCEAAASMCWIDHGWRPRLVLVRCPAGHQAVTGRGPTRGPEL